MNEIPLQKMEELEEKYNVHLHIEQYIDPRLPDKYYKVLKPDVFTSDNFIFLGNTIEEVEEALKTM